MPVPGSVRVVHSFCTGSCRGNQRRTAPDLHTLMAGHSLKPARNFSCVQAGDAGYTYRNEPQVD